jgi:DNA-binding CsgD family transcriptional regulator
VCFDGAKAIGPASGKPSSSIYFLVAPHGGIRPAQRRRSGLALTLAEREVISRGVTAHQSVRSIAKLLSRSPSTVNREMNRNGGYDRYRAALADENAWARAYALVTRWLKVRRKPPMAHDHLPDLEKARAALVNQRRTWAQTIASPGEIPENAIRAIIEVQRAIEVIDSAIEEYE